uniref:Ig-like domain-containing protein n=1 Tax=Sphenodon punctatus TaxID=8508 RepID=A0A8D0GJ94_SPHPU
MSFTSVLVIGIISVIEGANAAESVTQPDSRVTISQGDTVFLNCTYKTIGSPYLFWYKQYPNEAPQLLPTQSDASNEEKESRRGFWAVMDKQERSFHLRKNSSEINDSAVYLCALRDTVITGSREAQQKLSS